MESDDAVVAAAAAAAAAGVTGKKSDGDEEEDAVADHHSTTSAEEDDDAGAGGTSNNPTKGGGSRVHRSLPRIKTILEDEKYLSGILNVLEQAGCANYPFASTSNGWMTAFHNVYASIALECHHPTGKNRHLKFKEKMVELWLAMEGEIKRGKQSSESNPLYELGMKQLETYRQAVRTEDETRTQAKKGTARTSSAATRSSTPQKTTATPTAGAKRGGVSSTTTAAAAAALPPRKKAKVQVPNRLSSSVPSSSSSAVKRRDSGLSDLEHRLAQLEALTMEGLPAKLDTPLGELHALYLQHQSSPATRSEFRDILQPFYEDAVNSFLSQTKAHINENMNPSLMFKSLEGLNVLLRGHETSRGSRTTDRDDTSAESLYEAVKETYKVVLQAYLALINPQVAASLGENNRKSDGEAAEGSDDEDAEQILVVV